MKYLPLENNPLYGICIFEFIYLLYFRLSQVASDAFSGTYVPKNDQK